ncbi:long-chain-fatty-acid--CoA ligase [Nocardia vinacea]|uniref:Long-chain-fatty-acid--CoA ligase n=1 Tax=Nocardia vinacea TaxID=96468 RepID=A0ABZ1YX83_9NOCA|nr:long-chain-fatty-acid--CoA ligase [Nocardia vinacea]
MESTNGTIAGIIREWSAKTPDAPCLSVRGRTQSWREVFDRSSRIGAGLVGAGVGPQDRVLYLGKNGPEYFEILFGAGMAGAVCTAVNWRLAAPEIRFVVNDSQAKVLIIGHEFLCQLDRIRGELSTVETIVVIGGDGDSGYETWLAWQTPTDPEVPVADDDTALQIYTSGTTGRPKGVMFSSAAVRRTFAMTEATRITPESVVMVAMPVFHASGASQGIMALAAGAHCVIAAEAGPAVLLSLVERYQVTMTTLAPVVLRMILVDPDNRRFDVSSLDVIAYAGSPISPELLKASLARFGCRFLQVYGMTETIFATALLPEDHDDQRHPERLESAGRPLPGVSVRIADPLTGETLADGELGEVWVKSPTGMHGYWHLPDETAAALTPEGFIRTGDGGYFRDGYLYLRDRIKDMIVTGGENVYPTEVERVLLTHPAVVDAAVIGVPSVKWGETVKAVVVCAGSAPGPTASVLIAYTKQHLARYKCPTSVEFVGELPRNPSGKILKRVLRETYWQGIERRIG